MRIRSFIVDDELHNIENLTHLLSIHCTDIDVLGSATQVSDAVKEIHHHQPDLLFLDIRLGQETGFDLLSKLSFDTIEVIFVTAFDQYGIQAVKYAALDYLLKPIDSAELISAVRKAVEKINLRKQNDQLRFLLQELSMGKVKKIALPTQQEIRYVELSSIVRCESSNNYTFFFLEGGEKILIARTLKEYVDLLLQDGFVRVHQSHLVNRIYIKSWLKEDGGMLLLRDGSRIPVSRFNRDKIKKLLQN